MHYEEISHVQTCCLILVCKKGWSKHLQAVFVLQREGYYEPVEELPPGSSLPPLSQKI